MKAFFSLLWRGWKKFAQVLGIVNTKILLTITYFIVIGPVSLFARLFGADFLKRRMRPVETHYESREMETITLERLKRQF